MAKWRALGFISVTGYQHGFMSLCRTLKLQRELLYRGGALKDSPTLALQSQVRLRSLSCAERDPEP